MADILCLVNGQEDEVSFTWKQGLSEFPPYHLPRPLYRRLNQAVQKTRERLAEFVQVRHQEADAVAVRQAGERLARAGHD
jgi:hypothetical protein